jgi:2-oxoisovalerate dehydrogenase E2 component (dihydrolipoyl transacylase)
MMRPGSCDVIARSIWALRRKRLPGSWFRFCAMPRRWIYGRAPRRSLIGSTITISSLGSLGGIVSTPVINSPEVAIIGVNKIVERPVVHRAQVVVRKMMNLSSSFDHRIVDGWDAASFVQAIKAYLEQPATLFIDAPR